MSIRRVEIERFSVTSSKPFESVVAAVKAGVGRLDMVEFTKASKEAQTFAELEKIIRRDIGKAGLMLFLEFDHGALLRKETGLHAPKIVRLVIGNPLTMKEMAKHIPDAGSYAPTTVLVDERQDGVHLSYDKMASLLAPYGNASALAWLAIWIRRSRPSSESRQLDGHLKAQIGGDKIWAKRVGRTHRLAIRWLRKRSLRDPPLRS